MSPRAPEIVIVDNDLEALKALVEPLRGEFEFYLTISGNDALAMLAKQPIGVIIAGQTLYSGSGIEILVNARRRSPRTTRVLLASGDERKAVEPALGSAELFQVLQRPCTTEQLKEVLQAAAWSAQVSPDGGQVEHVVLETGEHRQLADSAGGVPVTVLTTDADLLEAIRAAVHEHHPVHLAARQRDAAELAAAGHCAVLVTDQALTPAALARITHEIKAREPALVAIAAGSREQGSEMMGLLGSGAIHRFLLKPVTPGLARLAVDSAAREHIALKVHPRPEPAVAAHARPEIPLELRPMSPPVPGPIADAGPPTVPLDEETQPPPTSWWRHPWFLAGAGALVLITSAAVLWWAFSSREPAADPPQLAIDRALASAEQAMRAGNYVEPPDASALFFYTQALELDAAQPAALAGIDSIADHYLQEAEAFMVEGELEAAAAALAVVRRVQPKHRRLHFLSALLKKDQQDLLALQARESATEGALREAKELLARARQIDAGRSGEVATTQAAIDDRERGEEITRMLDSARQRLAQGMLVTPTGDSAKFFLNSARRVEPGNLAVQQGLRELRERVVREADAAIEARQFDSARGWIREARDIEVDAAQIARLQERLAAAANQMSKGDLLALTVRRTQENRLLEPAQDNARYYLAQLNQIDPAYPGLERAVAQLGAKLVAGAQAATSRQQFDNAARLLAEARQIGYDGADLAAAESALRLARLPAPAPPPQAAPKRTKYVAPRYPQDALEDGTEGWVDLTFSVTAEGDVTDVRVEAAEPRNRFERAAIAAVRQWKFEPRAVAESDAAQRLKTRVQFDLAD